MKFSIIIPTYNRANILEECILSIAAVDFAKDEFEIIIINNNSTDGTSKICQNLSKTISNLRVFFLKKMGLHEGRHLGAKEAKGEVLIFCDDDILVNPNWLRAYDELFYGKYQAGMAGGNAIAKLEGDVPPWFAALWKTNPYGRHLSEFSLLELGSQIKEIDSAYIYGCNYAIKKELVNQFGGFHPDGFPAKYIFFRGDGEMPLGEKCQENGKPVFYHPDAWVYHRVGKDRLTLNYLYTRSHRQGISFNYSHIRKINGFSRWLYFKRYFYYQMKTIRSLFIRTPLFKNMQIAFWQGSLYHLKCLKDYPNLVKWVLQENYIKSGDALDYLPIKQKEKK